MNEKRLHVLEVIIEGILCESYKKNRSTVLVAQTSVSVEQVEFKNDADPKSGDI